MTYNPTKTYTIDPVEETRNLQANLVQLNLELIAQETKSLNTGIERLGQTVKQTTKATEQNSSSFAHDFLFLG